MRNPFTPDRPRRLPLPRWLRTLLGQDMSETEQRQRAQVIDTRAEVLLREVEARAKLAEIKANQSASELAALHLSTWAGAYMTLMVTIFLFAAIFLEPSSLGTITGLITLVVTSLAAILKSIVDGKSEPEENGHGKPPKDE